MHKNTQMKLMITAWCSLFTVSNKNNPSVLDIVSSENYEMYRATITAAIRELIVATGNIPEDPPEGRK